MLSDTPGIIVADLSTLDIIENYLTFTIILLISGFGWPSNLIEFKHLDNWLVHGQETNVKQIHI